MVIKTSPIIKGAVSGIILSCINTFFIILSLYDTPFEFVSYGIAIISIILAIGFLINEKIIKSVYTFFISIILFFITELIFSLSGIIGMVFKRINGASAEMWAGDGFGMLVILLFSFAGYLLGGILAYIISISKGRKSKKQLLDKT